MKHWILLLAIISLPLHAEIYKCVDQKGKTTFSQYPCDDSAEIIPLKTTQPAHPVKSVSEYSSELEAISIRTDILKLERRKRSLQRKLDTELAALKRKKLRANKSLAGATWEQSISSEMEAISTSYTNKIQSTQDQINEAKAELKDLRAR
ncbi:MAG: DUF4124 domain-containing protein [Candidatus Thiodiazotropha sp.]